LEKYIYMTDFLSWQGGNRAQVYLLIETFPTFFFFFDNLQIQKL